MDRVEELLSAWQECSITKDELDELKSYLKDRESRKVLLREFFTDAGCTNYLLVDRAGKPFGTPSAMRSIHKGKPKVKKRLQKGVPIHQKQKKKNPLWKPMVFGGIAACITYGIIFTFLVFQKSPDPDIIELTQNTGQSQSSSPSKLRVLATIKETLPGSYIIRNNEQIEIYSGEKIFKRDCIVSTTNSRVLLEFHDQSQIQLHGAAKLFMQYDKTGTRLDSSKDKRLFLSIGKLTASVKPQKASDPMIISTPHAQSQVLGTVFHMHVGLNHSLLGVDRGKVRFTRKSDGKSYIIQKGQKSIIHPDQEFSILKSQRNKRERNEHDREEQHERNEHENEHEENKEDHHEKEQLNLNQLPPLTKAKVEQLLNGSKKFKLYKSRENKSYPFKLKFHQKGKEREFSLNHKGQFKKED